MLKGGSKHWFFWAPFPSIFDGVIALPRMKKSNKLSSQTFVWGFEKVKYFGGAIAAS
jgi:hypothetical protein